MADFRVYHDAASALRDGSEMYGKSFGIDSGFYKYSPTAALIFVPFTFLSYAVSSALYYGLIVLGILAVFFVLLKRLEHETGPLKKVGWVLLIGALFMADHFERELHLGNVNLFLMLLAFAVFLSLQNGREWLAGALFALIVLFKPHFLILAPWVIWKQHWRAVFSFFITLPLLMLLPVLVVGWNETLLLHSQWFHAMRDHNIHLAQSPNTIYGLVNSISFKPMGMIPGAWFVPFVFFLMAVSLLAYVMFIDSRKPQWKAMEYMEFFLPVALIPNLVHTDTEHFMWTLPLILLLAVLLWKRWDGKFWIIIAMVVALIPYAINSPDIVGRKVMLLFDEGGLLGLSNLVLVVCAAVAHVRWNRHKAMEEVHPEI